jgi:hypothetical protein
MAAFELHDTLREWRILGAFQIVRSAGPERLHQSGPDSHRNLECAESGRHLPNAIRPNLAGRRHMNGCLLSTSDRGEAGRQQLGAKRSHMDAFTCALYE